MNRDDHRAELIKKCRSQLSAYPDSSLRRIYEYYEDDLTYILENTNPFHVLVELKKHKVFDTDKYQSLRDEPSIFTRTLLHDIKELGREAVIRLWECLYALWRFGHPNLLVMLDEISQTGECLVDQILLDELGHSLTPELADVQKIHKQHLMENTEILVAHRPPATTLDPKESLINENYVKLIVVSIDQVRRRPENELIQTGIKHEELLKNTQTGLEHISPSKLFRWSHQSQCLPHAVMVSGVPGVGKTTLLQKIVYDWVTGKHYQRFAFVFPFKFRDLNRLGEVSLEEMILQQYPYLEGHVGKILQDPGNVFFIFDGLDESTLQINFRSSYLSNPKQRTNLGEIVVSLVRQSLLKGCSVLITSRPTRLASVDTAVFQRMTEIMGFVHEDRLKFFTKFFENEELSKYVFDYVRENDTLYTFCYIPSYCWIICTVLSICLKDQPTNSGQLMPSLPKTVTQLFVSFVANILANHNQNIDGGYTARDHLTFIGWMAEHGVQNHCIIFDELCFESFNVRSDSHLVSCFLVEAGQAPHVDFTFLHLTVQEFFAALVHFLNYNSDRLQETLDDAKSYTDGRAEILLRFLCGLSDPITRSMLKPYVGEMSSPAAKQVITWIQNKAAEKQRCEKNETNKRELLEVFYYLFESRNKVLVAHCMSSNKADFSGIRLNPLDCSVLSFVFQSCREMEVNLNACQIKDEGLIKLLPTLHIINSLSLRNNGLTERSCPGLASGIANNKTLKILDLSSNKLEGPHFKDLMEALTASLIEKLFLANNYLTDRSCVHLATGIRNSQTLRMLDLSGNSLEGLHFRKVMEALTLSQIEELNLSDNQLTDKSNPHLTYGIKNKRALRTLDLSGNYLEGPNLNDLMEALENVQIEGLQITGNLPGSV